jgi:hypothetical protein
MNFRCALVISDQIGWNETRIGLVVVCAFDRRGGEGYMQGPRVPIDERREDFSPKAPSRAETVLEM